jgi:flavin-dependent dehydrogenase
MYDVIVIGARCAGAATAMLAARRGCRVLLVDRARFPSDIPHGHFIHRLGPQRLRDWGLLPAVTATCPPVTTMTMDFGDFPLVGRDLESNGVPVGLGPRRRDLDAALLRAATNAGVELREGFAVTGVKTDDRGRVTGIRGHAADRSTVDESAAITIGADGRRSPFARMVGARTIDEEPALTFWYFSYWSGMPDRGLELIVRDDAAIFTFPTGADLIAVFVAWRREALDRVRADVERAFYDVADRAPEFAARLRNGQRQERFYGATDLPNFVREAHGPGWALVGDAACHKDPMMALGICDAFRDAELLARAVEAGHSESCSVDEALAQYDQQRIVATMADYRENIGRAHLGPAPPDLLAMRARLRSDAEAARQFYLALEGMIAAPAAADGVSR